MSAKEWAVPVVLGLVTAGALWVVLPQDMGDGHADEEPTGSHSASSTTSSANPAIVLPFADGRARAGTELVFTVLAPRGQAAALAEVNRSFYPPAGQDLEWQGPRLAFYPMQVAECTPPVDNPDGQGHCDPYWAFGTWVLPKVSQAHDEPLLGVDGHNGTRITVHVFDEAGVLVATNAPENQTTAFRGRGEPEQLPGGVWYIGDQPTAPNGTRPVPSMARPLFEELKPLMHGLPAGGVASVRSDAFASVYGVLFVTVRIDGLVQAP